MTMKKASVFSAWRGTDEDQELTDQERKKLERKASCIKWLRRIIVLVVLLLLVCLLLVQVVQCIVLYNKGPTFFETSIAEQKEAAFPAITTCPLSGGYKEEILQEHGIPELSKYNNNKEVLSWSSNVSGVTEKELFHLATFDVGELISKLKIRTFISISETNTSVTVYPRISVKNPMFKEQRHRKFGKCYTFYPDEFTRSRGIYYIRIDFARDVKVYLHREGQFLELNGRMGYEIRLGSKFKSQVYLEDIHQMERENNGTHSCTRDEYDTCMYSKLEELMMADSGCVVPWTFSEHDVCTDSLAVNTSFWIAYTRVTNQQRDCLHSCDALMVNIGAKNSDVLEEASKGQYYFYFAPHTRKSHESPFYTFLSLMAEIGGYVGLLLGVSLWHFADWFGSYLDKRVEAVRQKLK